MGNPIHGSLDILEINQPNRISKGRFNLGLFTSFMKSLEAMGSNIPIFFKNPKNMRFFLIKVVIIKDSKSLGSESAENPKFLSREMMRIGMEVLFCVSLLSKNLVTN